MVSPEASIERDVAVGLRGFFLLGLVLSGNRTWVVFHLRFLLSGNRTSVVSLGVCM